jgi:hypothetical protein
MTKFISYRGISKEKGEYLSVLVDFLMHNNNIHFVFQFSVCILLIIPSISFQ